MKTQERVKLTVEQLDAMMTPGEDVHTFLSPVGGVLIGADWSRAELLELARRNGAELSGESATAMKHGAAVFRDNGEPVFVATNP